LWYSIFILWVQLHLLYINIHSHQKAATGHFLVQNHYQQFDKVTVPGHYSIGVHPWYIDTDNWQQQLAEWEKWVAHPQVLAVGECGLDKLVDTNWELQLKTFSYQLQWAQQHNKPLIIHCVKAFTEVQLLLKQLSIQVPVLFHGFNKNAVLANELISQGYYLSFGKALLQPHIQTLLASLPITSVLLETDDAAIDIKELYQLAATAFSIDVDSLSLQLQQNATRFFGGAKW
jgi:TatD DNase family protein